MSDYLKQGTNTVRVHIHRDGNFDLFDITSWLVSTIGHSSQNTWIRYMDPNNINWWCYDFKDSKHATMFALRWA